MKHDPWSVETLGYWGIPDFISRLFVDCPAYQIHHTPEAQAYSTNLVASVALGYMVEDALEELYGA